MARQSHVRLDPGPDDGASVLREIVDASENAVIGTRRGVITYWNRAAERLYGYSTAQALGQSIRITAPTSDGLEEFQAIDDAIGRDEAITQEYTIRRCTDGALIDVSLAVAPLHDAQGRVCGSSTIVRDITARRTAERERDDNRRLLAEAQSLARLGSFEYDIASGRLSWSEHLPRVFGLDPSQLAAGDRTAFHERIHPADREPHAAMLNSVAQSGEPAEGEIRVVDSAGQERILHTRGHLAIEGSPRIIGTFQDVSEMRALQRAASRNERLFLAAFEHAPNGVALIGLRDAERGRFVHSNATFAQMLGFTTAEELAGVALVDVTFPDDVAMSTEAFARLLAGETTTQEKRYVDRAGVPVWTLVRSTPLPTDDGSAAEYAVSQIVDLRERKRLEQRLRELADRDALTGLDNRRRFTSELDRVLAEDRRHRTGGALLIADLDAFKLVNDTRGHAAGDALLVEVARVLRESVRETDIVARLGGDEFAVILPLTDRDGAASLAAALRKVIAGETPVSASIGIACFEDHPGGRDALVRAADRAMYADKQRSALSPSPAASGV